MTTATRITTPFGAESTAAEVVAGIDLTGKRAIVTGGASGIGIETARALAGAGADVTIAVRDTAAGEKVAADIDGTVHVAPLELLDRASVEAFVAACALFYDAILDKSIKVKSDDRLDRAVAAATRRAVGQQWLFQRNTPDADISALYAVTLAWHYATTKSKAAMKPRAAIY